MLYTLGCTLPPEKWVLHPCSIRYVEINSNLVVSLESFLFLVTQGCNGGFGLPIWCLLGTGGCKRMLTFAIPVHSNSTPISPLLSIPPLPITGFGMKSAYLGGPCHGFSYNPRGFCCLPPFQCLTHFWLNLGPP